MLIGGTVKVTEMLRYADFPLLQLECTLTPSVATTVGLPEAIGLSLKAGSFAGSTMLQFTGLVPAVRNALVSGGVKVGTVGEVFEADVDVLISCRSYDGDLIQVRRGQQRGGVVAAKTVMVVMKIMLLTMKMMAVTAKMMMLAVSPRVSLLAFLY